MMILKSGVDWGRPYKTKRYLVVDVDVGDLLLLVEVVVFKLLVLLVVVTDVEAGLEDVVVLETAVEVAVPGTHWSVTQM